jgi:hypothetical protein
MRDEQEATPDKFLAGKFIGRKSVLRFFMGP